MNLLNQIKTVIASKEFKLALSAFSLIATGLAILAILVGQGIIKLTALTIRAIAISINYLNKWCDEALVATSVDLKGFQPIALLSQSEPIQRILITPVSIAKAVNPAEKKKRKSKKETGNKQTT